MGAGQVPVCTPLAAVAVAAFARPEISVPLEEISSVKVNDLSAIVEQPDVKKSVPAAAIRQEASSGKARLNMRVVDEAESRFPERR